MTVELGNRNRSSAPAEFVAVSKEQQGQETHVALIPCSLLSEPSIQQHVMAKVTYFADRARAETLFQFDEPDAAVAVIAPYAYGEKPEAGEVRVGSR